MVPRGANPGFRFRSIRATHPLASFSYSRCQTAHPPSLKLRRASKQARHNLGVERQSSSFPLRVFYPRVSLLPLRVVLRPDRGTAERRGGSLECVALARRDIVLPSDGRAPHGAPRGGFRLRYRRFVSRQCPPESAPRLSSRPGLTSRPLGLAPPMAAVRSGASGRHTPLRPQGISGDAPRERGCDNSIISAKCSQLRNA